MTESYLSNFVIGNERIWIKDRKTDDIANVVLNFGADNKGVKDSTEAIQKALDSGKPYVYFPNGHYKINDLIKVNSNTYIFGENAMIEQTSVTALGVLINNSDGNTGGWNANENITVDGLSFISHEKWGCLTFGHCKNINIINCNFNNDYNLMQGHLIELNSCFNVTVDNCYFTNKKSLNEMLQLDVATSAGFPWFGPYDETPIKNIKINKCTFYRDTSPTTITDEYIDSGIGSHSNEDDTIIQNVTITDCRFVNLLVGIRFRHLYNSIISNNIFEKCQNGISYRGENSIFRSVIISDNVLVGNISDFKSQISDARFGRGINIGNPMDKTQAIVVKNNIIRDFAGIGLIVQANNSLITGNYVLNNGSHGIYAGISSFKTTYTNNIAQSNRKLVDTPDNFYDIFIANSGKKLAIGANYVFGNCCEHLGMNIVSSKVSRSFVFNNKYQYIKYADSNNIDAFGNYSTYNGDYIYNLGQADLPTEINKWELVYSSQEIDHDSVWFTHGELTIPTGYTGKITLRLLCGTQEVARQTIVCDGSQSSCSVASVGFIKKGLNINLYASFSKLPTTLGNARIRAFAINGSSVVPQNF